MKILSASAWHHRFVQQAAWTAELRKFIVNQLNLSHCTSVLEVGCGTGAILREVETWKTCLVCGLDLRFDLLLECRSSAPNAAAIQANAETMPFPTGAFSASFSHFLFLWLKNPLQVLLEMRRITEPGGAVIAFAEPDYGGRIDHPAELVELGHLQGDSLRQQGADPFIGRKLAGLFNQVGLLNIQTGILGGHWGAPPSPESWESEWSTLESDLSGTISDEKLHTLREIDGAAWEKGERILFVPTFYAWGIVP